MKYIYIYILETRHYILTYFRKYMQENKIKEKNMNTKIVNQYRVKKKQW